ncbi:atp-dependent RNA helicase ddx5-related [Anaeramoeba flamelloides]|uniref:RNA helicase n=1 Tax=Anaeramoeba flamelloides TaxID=1746091 RepID=A0AAV7ZT36_9EUKA|nr:atp-dependent RNA helicase ddx5-related [Anaeramoeba flamelloides]
MSGFQRSKSFDNFRRVSNESSGFSRGTRRFGRGYGGGRGGGGGRRNFGGGYRRNNDRYGGYGNRNRRGYGRGGGRRGGRRTFREGYLPDGRLARVKQAGEEQKEIEFEKNFYKESEEVEDMTKKEAMDIRKEHEIKVLNCETFYKPLTTFKQADFPENILKLIKEKEFEKPSPIQAQTWPMVMSGNDLVGVARTGSGKTLSFLLPAIVHIQAQRKLEKGDGPIAIVLAPTRELAVQISEIAEEFFSRCDLKTACLYGGAARGPQIQLLRRGTHLIVATPGRLIDLIEADETNMNRVTYLVLDEADRMLDMGFEPQIRSIVEKIREDRQTCLWSATWPKEVQKLASELTNNSIRVNVGSMKVSANPNIKQQFIFLRDFDKKEKFVEKLKELNDGKKILVFVQRKVTADEICDCLFDNGIRSESIHGDKTQYMRENTLKRFKSGKITVMVATDVAARGLDIDDISFVVNYDFPEAIEDYIHRIGRTARAGKFGTSISFFTDRSSNMAKKLVKVLKDSKHEIPEELWKHVRKHQSSGRFRRRGRYGGGRRYGNRGYGGGGDRWNNRRNNRGYGNRGYGNRNNNYNSNHSDSETDQFRGQNRFRNRYNNNNNWNDNRNDNYNKERNFDKNNSFKEKESNWKDNKNTTNKKINN